MGSGKPRWYINTGRQKQLVDVAGVKNTGTRHFDQIETVAVEVREIDRITMRDLQDARGYSNMAHRCYLAATTTPTESDIKDAGQAGIGLIEIINKDKFKERLQAQYHEPDPGHLTEFLHCLWIVRCTLCQCYVFNFDEIGNLEGKSVAELVRARQFDFELDGKTAFEELEYGEVPSSMSVRRYLCRSCVRDLTIRLPKWSTKIGLG